MTSARTATRTHRFTESVIRDMTRVAREHDAINLAQGFPDFPAPQRLKDAACEAIQADINQYAVTWGSPRFRDALVAKYDKWYGMEVDGDREITVTCGGTEAMASIMLAVVNPGDEVIIFEPFYENYGPDTILCEARPIFFPLEPPHFRLDVDLLASLITERIRAIIVNTPNNPTGRVLDRAELEAIAALCLKHDLLAITDEIYEHIYYEGEHHVLATFEGMRERTITVSGLSKTFSVTGWRVGTIVAPPTLTEAIRKVHDFLTVGAPAPLQEACAVGMRELGADYYSEMVAGYEERRGVLVSALQGAGFRCAAPQGAYYVLADYTDVFGDVTPYDAVITMIERIGVNAVPGDLFFAEPDGVRCMRFHFAVERPVLAEAAKRLRSLAE